MKSRVENAGRNFSAIIIFQIINIVTKFGLRTVFIYCLGKEYLGVNGVFSNILSMLSLAELGLGSAIVYDIYKPVAKGDKAKICQFLKFYRLIYVIIGCFILLTGICLTPFLDKILTDVPHISNIKIIYVLFLSKTAISYFWAEYTSLFGVYQMEYINKNILSIFSIVKSIAESIFLIITHNYIVYLLIDILITIIYNFCIYRKAVILFPFIRNRALMLDREEIVRICRSAMRTFSIKLGGTIIGATDNLIISAYISTILVGIYSSYDMIIQLFLSFTVMIKNAVMGGVGNLCASENENRKYVVFQRIYFLYGSIYMIVFVCLINLLEPFITLWLGIEYHLDKEVVNIVVFNCYLAGMLQPIEIFTYADGLFSYYKWKPWVEAVINLIVSILFAKHLGLAGVFIGTSISRISTSLWFDAYILYHYSFHVAFIEYWKTFIKYFGITVMSAIVLFLIINKITISEMRFIAFVEKLVITLGMMLIIWLCAFYRTEEFRFYKEVLKRKLGGKRP